MSLVERFNVITGRRFWYRVEFRYREKGSSRWISKRTENIGFAAKNEVLDYRRIKKTLVPAMMEDLKNNHPHLLKNGYISVEKIAYLGWFKKG